MTSSQQAELRSPLQFGLFGLIASGIVSVLLGVGRACGLLEFRIEGIPGTLLNVPFSWPFPQALDWAIYFACGALLGLAYRLAFHFLKLGFGHRRGHVSALTGVGLGVIQWVALGVLIALGMPSITDSTAVLPTLPPLGSIPGFMLAAFILLIHCFFGGLLGSVAKRPRSTAPLEQAPVQIAPPQQRAA